MRGGRATGRRPIDEVHHDEAVVHHHPGQRQDADERDGRDGQVKQHVAKHRADDAERDGAHDEQRLHVGAQRYRHHRVDAEQRGDERPADLAEGSRLLLGAFGPAVAHAGVTRQQVWHELRLHLPQHLEWLHRVEVRVGGDDDGGLAVQALQGAVALRHLIFGHGAEGQLAAVRQANPHVLQVADGAPLGTRVAHPHPHLIGAALYALRHLAVKRLAHLPGQLGQRDAQCLGFRLHPQLDLVRASAGAALHFVEPAVAAQMVAQRFGGLFQHVVIAAGKGK